MKHSKLRRAAAALLALALVLGAGGVLLAASEAKAAKPASLPVKAETKTGVTVYANAKASIDASNLAEGYLLVTYTGGRNVKIKVQITKEGGVTYTYNLNNQGGTETFPLTEGDGKYTVKVFENTTGTKYAVAHSAAVELKLRNDFLPFLYPNQFVDYNAKSAVVSKAAEIVSAAGAATDLSRVQAVFDFVTKNFSYDYELAKTVQSGYLPVKEGDLLRLCRGDVRHAPQPEHPLQAGGGLCRDHVSCLDQRIYRRRGLGGQGDLF